MFSLAHPVRWLAGSLAATLALGGCCDGPFVAVDCMADEARVFAVDAQGAPVTFDEARYSWDGGPSEPLDCASLEDTASQGCTEASVFVDREGELTVELLRDGVVVGSTLFDVYFPSRKTNECCSGIYSANREVELPPEAS